VHYENVEQKWKKLIEIIHTPCRFGFENCKNKQCLFWHERPALQNILFSREDDDEHGCVTKQEEE
jgi:hypothetical protein